MKDPYEPYHDEDLAYWPPDRIKENRSIEDVPAAPEVHHEPDSVVFGTREIEARIIKALTGIGLTVATSTNAIESMRQEGIAFTILSP